MAPRKKPARGAGRKPPKEFRARVRMYRHGLGDCFLLTFPRSKGDPFQLLIDCGALARKKEIMQALVGELRDHVRSDGDNVRKDDPPKACLDAVVGTHEHRDHLSGFNQAREIFNEDFDFKSVWLAWTENLKEPDIDAIKQTRRKNIRQLQDVMTRASKSDHPAARALVGDDVASLLQFNSDDDDVEGRSVADALEYLKLRGRDAGDLRFLKPGGTPFRLDGVDDVLVYVLGPPLDPVLLKTSSVTERMKQDGVVYHLSAAKEVDISALAAAVETEELDDKSGPRIEKAHPFAVEHRFFGPTPAGEPSRPQWLPTSTDFGAIEPFVKKTYDAPGEEWRRIDDDWARASAVGNLALALDNDTNNTSLVLAFEFETTGEVLLFAADAQIGSWQSWGSLEFEVEGRSQVTGRDLLRRTVFYKVGHHCSHNATMAKGGLELMDSDTLVAFIPLDIATAENQGAQGWKMPAPPLYRALQDKAGKRVVISDVTKTVGKEAAAAGVTEMDTYIDFHLM